MTNEKLLQLKGLLYEISAELMQEHSRLCSPHNIVDADYARPEWIEEHTEHFTNALDAVMQELRMF